MWLVDRTVLYKGTVQNSTKRHYTIVISSHGGYSPINDWEPFPEKKEVNVYCFLKNITDFGTEWICALWQMQVRISSDAKIKYRLISLRGLEVQINFKGSGGELVESQETIEAWPRIGQGSQTWKDRCPRISKISILGLWKTMNMC